MEKTVFATTNRHLENFLYMHRVEFIGQHKTEENLNEWIYAISPSLMRSLEEYDSLYGSSYVIGREGFRNG